MGTQGKHVEGRCAARKRAGPRARYLSRCTSLRSRLYSKSPLVCRKSRPLRTRFSLNPTLGVEGGGGQGEEPLSHVRGEGGGGPRGGDPGTNPAPGAAAPARRSSHMRRRRLRWEAGTAAGRGAAGGRERARRGSREQKASKKRRRGSRERSSREQGASKRSPQPSPHLTSSSTSLRSETKEPMATRRLICSSTRWISTLRQHSTAQRGSAQRGAAG